MQVEDDGWNSVSLGEGIGIRLYGHDGRPIVAFPSQAGRHQDFEGDPAHPRRPVDAVPCRDISNASSGTRKPVIDRREPGSRLRALAETRPTSHHP